MDTTKFLKSLNKTLLQGFLSAFLLYAAFLKAPILTEMDFYQGVLQGFAIMTCILFVRRFYKEYQK
jgi:hypothetical protein